MCLIRHFYSNQPLASRIHVGAEEIKEGRLNLAQFRDDRFALSADAEARFGPGDLFIVGDEFRVARQLLERAAHLLDRSRRRIRRHEHRSRHAVDDAAQHAQGLPLLAARGGPLEMGSVGGGTGMITYGFKGGSASASRRIETAGTTYTLGAFVQSNFGRSHELTISGVPVGRTLTGGEVLS
ncbi:MAG: P1 family peptidase, partial [Betaproteobacteria bacterium]|nr:P1 family peptidase [Betaproteobacteria bacterium]